MKRCYLFTLILMALACAVPHAKAQLTQMAQLAQTAANTHTVTTANTDQVTTHVAQLRIDLADTLTLKDVHEHKKTWRRTKISLTSTANPALNHSDSARFRGRGNSSWAMGEKKPYRFKLDKSHALLGGKKGKAWVLLSQPMYGSLLTNPIGFRAAQLVGTVAANHVLPVELTINGEYRGLYLLTEQVDIAGNSVKVKDESKAALLELDTYDGEFKDATFGLPVSVKAPEAKDYEKDYGKAEEKKFSAQLRSEIDRFTAAVKAGKAEEVVDVDDFARYFFVNALCDNRELRHPKSTFVHRQDIFDEKSLWTFGPVWDVDWAFGYEGKYYYLGTPPDSSFLLGKGPEGAGKKLFRDMFLSQKVRDAYQRVCHEFVDKGGLEQLKLYLQDFEKVVAKAAKRDWERWILPSTGIQYSDFYAHDTPRWIWWLRKRAEFLVKEADHWQATKGVTYMNDNTVVTGIRALLLDDAATPTFRETNATVGGRVPAAVYDLSGRRVAPSQLSNRPSLQIVNGKKVVR